MKKLLYLSLSLLLLTVLTGCENIRRAIRGNDYADSQAQTNSSSAAKSYQQELKKALSADGSAFPQLTKNVSEKEAEAILHTSMGDITIKLFPKYAPLAVNNFLTHAKKGYYNGLTFHRVISDFMIQSGDPNGDGTGGESIWKGNNPKIDSGKGFANEISAYLYNLRGALAMANTGANTNGSQFYINQNPRNESSSLSTNSYPKPIISTYANGGNPSLDGNYTVFGQVIEGMDVVDKIATVNTDSNDKPTSAITINSIEVVKDYNFD